MTRLDQFPEVIELAKKLGIGSATPVDAILNHCRRRIDGWVAENGGIADIQALEVLVTQRLQMVFEEILRDEDFDRITEKYARAKRDPVFATMRMRFEDTDNLTYGALIQRRSTDTDALDRFVAVIDCRGTNKLARRFFTRWHEIAHRMTTHGDMSDPVYRSENDPIERMMDEIAGHIGFYEPIFVPAFSQASAGNSFLTFGTIGAVIKTSFPTASFQSTLFACARRLPTPLVYLEAAIGHKKEVQRRIEDKSPRLFATDELPRPGELRAVMVIPNKPAQQEGFVIPMNMRVPESSVIYRLLNEPPLTEGNAQEDLSLWESKGRRLEERSVIVEARAVPDRVIAIVQPTEPVRKKAMRSQSKSFLAQ